MFCPCHNCFFVYVLHGVVKVASNMVIIPKMASKKYYKYSTPQHNRSVDRLLIELHFGEVVNKIANCVCEEELMEKRI